MAENKKELFLVIDVGTQSIRASFIDLKGNIKHIVKTQIEPYYSVQPGWAEQNPEYYWKVLSQTCSKLFSSSRVDKKTVQCATITTQRDTMINLDKNGKPLRPAIVWLDQRRAKKESWPPLLLSSALKLIDMYDALMYAYTECESNWLRQNEPEIWDNTHMYLFLSGYLTYKLTGEYTDSTGNQVGFMPFDVKKQDWADSSDMKWSTYPMDKSKLTKLVQPGEVLGYISKKASTDTGIPVGLPVIAAAADKACEVLGSGCLTPETACLSYGTTATLETTNKKYVEVIPFIPPFPSAVPGSFNTEVMIFRGYWMISWFKKEFGMREELIAKKKKIAPEVLFDSLIKDIPPGSMGLMLQPYWSPGVKVPGPEAKGSIIGFGDVHTRAHIYRAIIEGIGFALKDGCIRTEKRNKVKIEKLRVSGGGSQSKIAMQITADIFDLPAERPHTFETSSLGAAIDAAVGMKFFPDFESAIKEMTHIRDVFEPIPANRDIYKKLFENIYQKMYGKLKPLYSDIRHITGYPVER
jgi:sugar (pentulose or hexulose) kinase